MRHAVCLSPPIMSSKKKRDSALGGGCSQGLEAFAIWINRDGASSNQEVEAGCSDSRSPLTTQRVPWQPWIYESLPTSPKASPKLSGMQQISKISTR